MSDLLKLYNQVTNCDWALIMFPLNKGHIDGDELHLQQSTSFQEPQELIEDLLDGGELISEWLIPAIKKLSNQSDGWYHAMLELEWNPPQIGHYPPPNVEAPGYNEIKDVYVRLIAPGDGR